MFVILATFLTVYILLVGSATPALLVNSDEEGTLAPPTFQVAEQPNQFGNYTVYTINATEFVPWKDLDYARVYWLDDVCYVMRAIYFNGSYQSLQLNVLLFDLGWTYSMIAMQWFNPAGSPVGYTLTDDQMNFDHVDGSDPPLLYTVIDSPVVAYLRFSWDADTYSSPGLAFVADALTLFHGTNPIIEEGGDSAAWRDPWTFVTNVFNLIQFSIDGRIPPLIAALIFSPVFISGGFLIWYFVKEIIPG